MTRHLILSGALAGFIVWAGIAAAIGDSVAQIYDHQLGYGAN